LGVGHDQTDRRSSHWVEGAARYGEAPPQGGKTRTPGGDGLFLGRDLNKRRYNRKGKMGFCGGRPGKRDHPPTN